MKQFVELPEADPHFPVVWSRRLQAGVTRASEELPAAGQTRPTSPSGQ